jgi:hypothetical protein
MVKKDVTNHVISSQNSYIFNNNNNNSKKNIVNINY